MPVYGQGNQLTLIVNTFLADGIRFGLHFQGGAAGKPGLSTANLNHFSIDGKVYKLASMNVEGIEPRHKGLIKTLSLKMRDNTSGVNQCEVAFTMKFKMIADVNAVVVYVHEVFEHGYVSGWCSTDSGRKF